MRGLRFSRGRSNMPAMSNDARRASVRHAMLSGLAAAALVVTGIYFGSRHLRDFDSALVSYAGASVFSAFGLGYRYGMWLERPPTRLYWRRGWQVFFQRLPVNIPKLFVLAWDNLVAQRFIEKRSRLRWLAHLLHAWGCMLAAAVTFPLSFGWIRFESSPTGPWSTRRSSSASTSFISRVTAWSYRTRVPN